MTTEEKMQLVDWLDDLCVRFIINLPQEELESVERICFQVEEAQWFYEDFIRPLDPSLPSMNLRNFCLRIFQHCPLLSAFSQYHHSAAFSEFLAYKTRVPVRGAIMLNDAMDQVVLVKGWKKSAAWSFPRGKINKDEKDLDCAIREVYEETGYDLRTEGMVGEGQEAKSIEVTMREQHMKLFVFRGIPMDAYFEPRTRKEISRIDWYKLSDLPTYKKTKQHQYGNPEEELKTSKFYMVAPFLVPLRRWIGRQRKNDVLAGKHNGHQTAKVPAIDAAAEDETAGETSAQEEEYIPAAPGDFGRLSSNLRVPHQPSTLDSLPEVLDANEPAQDTASELKRMLSVGAQTFSHQPSVQTSDTSANLLSILRGNPMLPNPLAASAFPPQTPAEQISEAPTEPRSPTHQHRNREPPIPTSQPPLFPITTPPTNMQNIRDEQSLQDRLNALNNAVNQQNKMRSPTNTPVDKNLRRDSLAFRPAQISPPPKPQSQDLTQRVPGPFQRTGDSNSSSWQQFGEVKSPPVPAANKLPLPKLNSHTLGLLNTFKGSAPAPLVSPIEPSAPGFGRSSRSFPVEANSGSLDGALSNLNRPGLAAPVHQVQNNRSPAMTVSPPGTGTNGYSSASPMPESARTVQQNTLLNLFRTPSLPTAPGPASPNPKPNFVVPEPVELSAAPNTPRLERQPGQVQILQRPKPIETIEPKSLGDTKQAHPPHKRHHRQHPSGQISATVSGPLTTPDFTTLQKRENQNPTPTSATGTGSTTAGFPGPSSPQAATPAAQPLKLEPNRHEHTAAAEGKQQDTPRPFQPRILQRPKQPLQTAPQPTPSSTVPPFDRRDSLPQDQRNNLLSLFGKSATQSPVLATGSPLASPIEKPRAAGHISPVAVSRSRLDSLASAASGASNGAVGASRSQTGVRSGDQSPVTPKDRDFLMGYLQGVVKGGK